MEREGNVPVESEGRLWPRTASTISSSRLLMHTEIMKLQIHTMYLDWSRVTSEVCSEEVALQCRSHSNVGRSENNANQLLRVTRSVSFNFARSYF